MHFSQFSSKFLKLFFLRLSFELSDPPFTLRTPVGNLPAGMADRSGRGRTFAIRP
jgi:hypothetical protein